MADAEVIAGQRWRSRYTSMDARVISIEGKYVIYTTRANNGEPQKLYQEDFLHNYRR